MGTKNNPGAYDCYENAEPDEPMFVLLGRDQDAPICVRLWAGIRNAVGEDSAKVAEANACADAMEKWRLGHPKATTEAVPTPPGFMICPDCNGMGEIHEMTSVGHGNIDEHTRHCYRCEKWQGFVPIDHTSGVIRCHYAVRGGHVHCDVFGPYSGRAGQVVISIEEWEHFKTKCSPGWWFIDDAGLNDIVEGLR